MACAGRAAAAEASGGEASHAGKSQVVEVPGDDYAVAASEVHLLGYSELPAQAADAEHALTVDGARHCRPRPCPCPGVPWAAPGPGPGLEISAEINRYTRYIGFIGGARYYFYRPKLIL